MRSLEVSMLKTIFFVLGMMSCAKHTAANTASNAGLLGFAGENFSSTNSPCLDGVFTAMDHSCAVPVGMEESLGYIVIQCTHVRQNAPRWNEYIVISVTDPTAPDLEAENSDTTLICVDPYARIYMQKRP